MAKRTLEERAVREHKAAERAALPTMEETGDGTLTPDQRAADAAALDRAMAILGADHGLEVVDRLDGGLPPVLATGPDAAWGLVAFQSHTAFPEPVALVFASREHVEAHDWWNVMADGRITSLVDLGRVIEAWRAAAKTKAEAEVEA